MALQSFLIFYIDCCVTCRQGSTSKRQFSVLDKTVLMLYASRSVAEGYKRANLSNDNAFSNPFVGVREAVLCSKCAREWKVLLNPNAIESRPNRQRQAIRLLENRILKIVPVEKELPQCALCANGEDLHCADLKLSCPLIVSSVPEDQLKWFVGTLALKSNSTWHFAFELCKSPGDFPVCSSHRSLIRHLHDLSKKKADSCAIPSCVNRSSRTLPPPSSAKARIEMEDALACIAQNSLKLEDVIRKPICSGCFWVLSNGDPNSVQRWMPKGARGVASLNSEAIQCTVIWVRDRITRSCPSVRPIVYT